MDVPLYRRYTEANASGILGVSPATLKRIRTKGAIAYIRVSDRHVSFFGFQLLEYLLENIECPATANENTKSETTGSPSAATARCRTWFDTKTRQTCRASLGTTDFEEAKQALTDWFVANHVPKSKEPDDHPLATIIARYWQHHGQHIISAERTRISLDYWLDFYGEHTLAEITDVSLQEDFHTWLAEKGMRATTVRRALSAGRAAINFAWKRGEIANAPYIIPVTDKERKAAPPKGRPLEVEEVAKIFDTTKIQACTCSSF